MALIFLLIILGFDISNKVGEIERIRGELYSNSENINKLAILRSDYNKAQPYFSELDNFLPTRDELINFSKEMNVLAEQSGVFFDNPPKLSNENTSQNNINNINSVDVTATIKGGFDNILIFLKSIEKSRYVIKYDTLDISKQNGNSNYEAKLKGKIFYLINES